ncbi:MAG: hypothetical protein JJ895_03210 [Balneolaceae bacterium]|nr:hypothetical protein [Balneolaceae bacterium]
MLARTKYLFITFLMMLPAGAIAQSIQVKGIEIYGQELSGMEDLGSLESSISNTRNPLLFKTKGLAETEEKSQQYSTGFSIDFHLINPKKQTHEYILGIQAGQIESYFTSAALIEYDSLAANTSIRNVSEFFNLKAGYQRVFRSEKKLKLTAGGVITLGFPVSSTTYQTINTELYSDTFQFFGKQSASIGLSVPLSARLKVVRNVSIALTSRPTFMLHNADGNLSTTLFRGTTLSLHFKLRDQ